MRTLKMTKALRAEYDELNRLLDGAREGVYAFGDHNSTFSEAFTLASTTVRDYWSTCENNLAAFERRMIAEGRAWRQPAMSQLFFN